MDSNRYLTLEANQEHLEEIRAFLNTTLPKSIYSKVFYAYLKMAHELKLYQLIISFSNQALNAYDLVEEDDYEAILQIVFDACLLINDTHNALKYMDIMKKNIKVMNQYKALFAMYQYQKHINEDYLETLKQLEKDVLPQDMMFIVLEAIYQYYLHLKQYEQAYEYLKKLDANDIQRHPYDEYELLFQMESYDLVLEKALIALKKRPSDGRLALYVIQSYIALKQYSKATVVEVQYEEEIDQLEDHDRLFAYELLSKMYQEIQNRPSMVTYQDKLKKLKKFLEKQKQKEQMKPEVEKETVGSLTPKIEPVQVAVEPIVHPAAIKASKTQVQDLKTIMEWLIYSHQIDEKVLKREYFRTLFMKVSSHINASEIIVYTKEKGINFFHYKKERLYDKQVIKEWINYTPIERVLRQNEPYFGIFSEFKQDLNPVTHEGYTENIKVLLAFPIGDFGVLLVHYDYEITDLSIVYDLIEGLAQIIETRMIDEMQWSRFKIENKFLNQIVNHPRLPIRILTDTTSHYNEAARALLNVETYYHLDLWIQQIEYKSVHAYKELIQKMMSYANQIETITYRFNQQMLTEHLYSVKKQGEIQVISYFIDETNHVNQTEHLVIKATTDIETSLFNMHALYDHMRDYLESKATFILMEMDQSFKYVYGSKAMNDFFKEFTEVVTEYFNATCYRYDFNQLIVTLPYNDIRSVTKEIKAFYKRIEQFESKVLKNEKMTIYSGILRYPTQTVEKNLDRIFKYMDIALELSKRKRDEMFAFFSYNDYENEIFEQNIIDQMNIALEHKQFELTFNQIINIEKNVIWQYESELYLPHLNVDIKYIYKIAKKRNKLIELEFHHIEKVCLFLSQLEKETKRLIKLTIPVSKETFLMPKFNVFLLGTLKKYHIPAEFIHIKTDVDLKTHHYVLQINELVQAGISLDTTMMDMAVHYDFGCLHMDYKEQSSKWKIYVTETKKMLDLMNVALVIRQVKTKDAKEKLSKMGIKYIEGTLYKQMLPEVLISKIKESLS